MFAKKGAGRDLRLARWLLTHMDRAELQRLLLRDDVPRELWRLIEGEDDEPGMAEPVTGDSPLNT